LAVYFIFISIAMRVGHVSWQCDVVVVFVCLKQWNSMELHVAMGLAQV
jgi:hypothetical protein